jgi:hypothetical protein
MMLPQLSAPMSLLHWLNLVTLTTGFAQAPPAQQDAVKLVLQESCVTVPSKAHALIRPQ